MNDIPVQVPGMAPWPVTTWGHTAHRWDGHIGSVKCAIIVYGTHDESASPEAQCANSRACTRNLLTHLFRLGIIPHPNRDALAAAIQHKPDCPHYARELHYSLHPHACRTCSAHGELEHTENGAPYGAGYWPMPVVEPCRDCTDKGLCPNCGADLPDEVPDTVVCPACGWHQGHMDLTAPPLLPCTCNKSLAQPSVYDVYADLYASEL